MVSSWNNSRELVSALLFLYLSGVRGAITSPPQNTATKVGSQTYLNCSGNNSVPAWKFGEQGMDVVLIELGSSCSVSSNYLSRYRGEGQGSNTCNLIVLNPSLQESGIYACQDLNLRPKYAVLTVLSSSGKPTVNNGSEVVEGDQLTITCAVEYSTASETLISVPIAPNLNWTTSGISIPNAVAVKTNVSVTSSLTVAATRAGIPTYDCTAQFLPPANKPDSAPNAPSNVYIGGTYPITGVYYPPTSVEINRTSLNQCIYSNKVFFTCHAASNPPAHYEWKDLTSDSNTSGQLIEVSHGGTYQCVATTTFRNKTYSANASTTVLGCEIPGNVTVKIIGRGECNNGVCDCGGHDSMEFECHASGIPPPYYKWRWISFGKSGSVNESKTKVYNGTYTCTVFNDFEGKTYNSSVVVNITGCSSTMSSSTTSNTSKVSSGPTPDKIVPAVVVPCCWVLLNLIAMSVFLIYYNERDPNGKHEHKKMLNYSFSWLKLMLPCLNESCGGGCSVWVFLFGLMSITIGLIVFPILLVRSSLKFSANKADNLSTSTMPASISQETELKFSQICDKRDENAARSHGRGATEDHLRPLEATRDPLPHKECNTTTFPPSKTHPHENKETKQKDVSVIPNYTPVNKKKIRKDDQEGSAYSVLRNPDNDDFVLNAAVPLPPIKAPHQIPAPNPNAPLYGEINLSSQSTSLPPVQFLAEETDPQYAPLKNT